MCGARMLCATIAELAFKVKRKQVATRQEWFDIAASTLMKAGSAAIRRHLVSIVIPGN